MTDPDEYHNPSSLEKAVLYMNNNPKNGNGKKTFSEKLAHVGYNLRSRGAISKHTAGAIVSFHHATLGKDAQTELEKLWEVGPGYFTKWHTTLWYALSHIYEHGPIFGTSALVNMATGLNEGNYLAIGNWAAGTLQNIIRSISSWIFKRPMGVISAVAAPMQIHYYRNEIKHATTRAYNKVKQPIERKYLEAKKDFLEERDYLMKQL